MAFSWGKCLVFQAREETGRRQSFSPLLSVLTETLRDIFARTHTFGKCGAFMVEATSRLIDACRLNPSSGGGGGAGPPGEVGGAATRGRRSARFAFSFTFSSLGLYSNTELVVLGVVVG